MLWVILSISIKILIWPHMLSLRFWASRPVLICMSGLDNVWGPFQSEKKPLVLLYKRDHIPRTGSRWLSFFKHSVLAVWVLASSWKDFVPTSEGSKMECSFQNLLPSPLYTNPRELENCPFVKTTAEISQKLKHWEGWDFQFLDVNGTHKLVWA